jgi:uncharacterized protein (TIGR00255 family)
MGLQSMTGFGRAAADHSGSAIAWEVKSVNGKTLEARLRLPSGFERLEQPVRQAIQKRFARGNVQAVLTLSRAAPSAQPVVNQRLLAELAAMARRLQDEFGAAPATADGLLSLRGVLETPDGEEDEAARAGLDAAILAAFDSALDALAAARRDEGAALGSLLDDHIAAIEALTLRAAAIRARLAAQVALLLDAAQPLDEARLAMEAAFLATRADIREEIDRLKTHVASAHALLAAGGPAGRKLDFLSQEFNRESNTLCSKSNAASVTAIGLELKAVVDQFREQVQNLE